MLYIDILDAIMVCGILYKSYASLIITFDECRFILHIFQIRQKLQKLNCFLCAITSGHILCHPSR